LTENAGHEIAGHEDMKTQDMNLRDMTNIVWNWSQYIRVCISFEF